MFGKPDPKKMEKMMKKLNLNLKQVEAESVIIKTKAKNIIISNPEIMIANMMGREVYQITGEVSESTGGQGVREEDVKIVMEKTGKDRDTVVKKLEELNSDLAKAILELKEVEEKD